MPAFPLRRWAEALALGAITGAGVTSVPCILAPIMVLLVFPVALVCWLAGLLLIGAPIGAVLWRLGLRRRRVAILLGAVTAPVSLWTWLWLTSGRPFPFEADILILSTGLLLGIAGAVAGNAVWAVGCGPSDARPAVTQPSSF